MRIAAAILAKRAEAKRACILEVAERLFRTLGYQKTAVADIARELGMSPANLYRFFPSKSAINEAMAERLLGNLVAELEAIAAGPGTAEQRFRRLITMKFELCVAQFMDERRVHDMVAAAMAEHWGVIETFIGRTGAALARIITDGVRSGEFAPTEPRQAAKYALDAVVCWSHPLLLQTCIAQRGMSVEQMRVELAGMTDFLLRALRGPLAHPSGE